MSGPAEFPSRRHRAWVSFAMLVLVGTFLSSVHLFLTRDQGRAGPGTLVEAHPRTKVFAFVVDGIRPEDAADPRLQFLAAYRERGFVATVNPCLEALTVPCVNEAMSGTATAGLLGAYQNLVTASATGTSSLFADVAASGRTTAIIHHGQYGGFRSAFTDEYRGRKDDWGAARKFIAAGIDFIVWHYPKLDEAAHHHKVGSKGYLKALDVLQADGAALQAALPPDYKLVVYGDHGHTNDGRHIFGLDIPTVYMTDAMWFGSATPEGRLSMPTYRMLLGAELGFLPPAEYDGVDLSSRLPEGSAIREASRGRVYTGPPQGGAAPTWVLVAAVALGGTALAMVRGSARWWIAAGMVGAAVLGFQYLSILPHIHYTRALPYVGLRIAGGMGLGAAVAVGMGFALCRLRGDYSAHPTLLAAGALGAGALALPGTLYNYGLFQALPHLLVWAAAFVLIPGLGARRHERGVWIAGALLLGGWWLLGDVHVGTFSIQAYPRLKQLLPWVLPLAWGTLAALLVPGVGGAEGEPSATPPPSGGVSASLGGRWVVRGAVGAVAALGASGEIFVAGYGLAAVCVAVVALSAWTFRPAASVRAVGWGAVALVVTTSFGVRGWYGHGDGLAVACFAGMAGAWAVLGRGARGTASVVASVGLVVLVYLGLAPASGLRTNGLEFNFAIAWLPDDLHLRLWPVVAAGLLVKVLAPGVMMLAVARHHGLRARADVVMAAVGARLAAGAAGVAGLLVANAAPPRYRLFEQLEDLVAWSIVAGVVLWSVRGANAGEAAGVVDVDDPTRADTATA